MRSILGINPIDAYIGGRLKEKRISLNLSQNKLAEKLGLTFQQIQKYENKVGDMQVYLQWQLATHRSLRRSETEHEEKGQNRIGGSRLYELSKILGVSVGYFFEYYENLSNKTFLDYGLHRDIQKAIRLFESAKNLVLRKNMLMALKSVYDGAKEFKGDN